MARRCPSVLCQNDEEDRVESNDCRDDSDDDLGRDLTLAQLLTASHRSLVPRRCWRGPVAVSAPGNQNQKCALDNACERVLRREENEDRYSRSEQEKRNLLPSAAHHSAARSVRIWCYGHPPVSTLADECLSADRQLGAALRKGDEMVTDPPDGGRQAALVLDLRTVAKLHGQHGTGVARLMGNRWRKLSRE